MIDTCTRVLLAIATAVLSACATSNAASTRSPRPRNTEIGAFTLTEGRNALTNRSSPMLSTFDNQRNGMLGWWCAEDSLSVLIGLNGDVAKARSVVFVRSAFDSAAPTLPAGWLVQRQNGFTMAYLRPDAIPAFTTSAVGAREARVEVTNPDNNSVVVYHFALNGLAEARPKLSCGPSR